MERSTFLATRREFSPSLSSSLAVNSSISLRSFSSRFRRRSVKSFALESNSVQFSFQPPPVPRLRVQRGDVVHALARHFKAGLAERVNDLVTIPHGPVLDTLEQVVPDQVSGGGFEAEARPQPSRLDVGAVTGLLHPGPRRIVRASPAVFGVEGVPERAERLLPARRGDVEAAPGLQVASRGEDVDVSAAALLTVEHGRPCVAVEIQSRPRGLLEGVQNLADLFVGRLVLRRPRDHPGGVLVLEGKRIGHGGYLVGISPEHLDAFARLPGRVPLTEEVAGRIPGRAGSAGEELNEHRPPCSQEGTVPPSPA